MVDVGFFEVLIWGFDFGGDLGVNRFLLGGSICPFSGDVKDEEVVLGVAGWGRRFEGCCSFGCLFELALR